MSPYDITRLSPSMPARDVGAGRDHAITQPGPGTSQDVPAKGVTVSTDAKISAGEVRVDNQRVGEIRQALRDGSYPIVPTEITDAIIAARLMLSGGQ